MTEDRSRLAMKVAIVAILVLGLASTGIGIATLGKVQNGTTQSPVPVTTILTPSNGATLSGNELLAAKPLSSGVTAVDFLVTGGKLHDTKIGTATLSFVGADMTWNTTTVANGTYTLVSAGYNGAGQTDLSFGVTVTVKN